ncbi:MAG TPA: hypothetical protein VM012_02700 [Flavitalea sp.]|nr:hypothetical protein [Flavitalea sp.]
MGYSLIHEHILVDFTGATNYNPLRWKREDVIRKVIPFLQKLKRSGCETLVDCTPAYLGRDVLLLQELSERTGLSLITNTGYYGGSDNKFLPQHAFLETDRQLADRWTKEAKEGIDDTQIRPGFIKISVNNDSLSDISKKLIRAAGYCHLETGLVIASHTGPAVAAFEEIEILKQLHVSPHAFIWVHAQIENDWNKYITAAKEGAWISLDGLNEINVDEYVKMISFMKTKKLLHQVLVSHDAGWYDPEKPDGGVFRSYTTLFEKLIPSLKQSGFSSKEIDLLVRINPRNAFELRVRKI